MWPVSQVSGIWIQFRLYRLQFCVTRKNLRISFIYLYSDGDKLLNWYTRHETERGANNYSEDREIRNFIKQVLIIIAIIAIDFETTKFI